MMFEDPATLTWLMILFAIVIFLGFATYLYRLKIAAREREVEMTGKTVSPQEIDEVRDRLAVLERIASDRGPDIATEIEALRDPRRSNLLGHNERH